jgi:predicted nucleotidyltransferase
MRWGGISKAIRVSIDAADDPDAGDSTAARSRTWNPDCHSIVCYYRLVRPADMNQSLTEAVSNFEGLRLLLLFGSRARGDERADSDWDFGYLGSTALDVDGLLATLVLTVGSDRIDLVNLARAGGQLRFRAAGDSVPLFATDAKEFPRFWFDAVSFWCDMQPVLRAGYEEVLSELPR